MNDRSFPRTSILAVCVLMQQTGTGQQAATPAADAAAAGVEAAQLHLKLRQPEECRQALAAVLAAEPGNVEALRLLGRLELSLGKAAEADAAGARALQQSPDDAEARLIRAAAQRKLGKPDEAAKLQAGIPEEALARWREEYPEEAAPTPDAPLPAPVPDAEAVRTAERATATDLELEKARAALAASNLPEADTLTEAAIARWPENTDAQMLRADFLSTAKRLPEAVALLRQLKAAHPAGAAAFPAQLDLAYALNESGLKEEAKAAFTEAATEAYPPEVRTAATTALAELRHGELLEAGEKALADGKMPVAQNFSEELMMLAPQCPLALAFRASVFQATGQPEKALDILSNLKTKAPLGKRFDPQMAYAGALASTRNYSSAIRQYEEVLKHPDQYSEEERKDAESELRSLKDESSPNLFTEVTGGSFEEGDLWRGTAQYRGALSEDGTRVIARFSTDIIRIAEGVYPSAMHEERWYAKAGVELQAAKDWKATLLAGGFDNGGMASASLDHENADGLSFSLRAAWNDPVRDTLLIEALDGRQHTLAANLSIPFGGNYFAFDFTAAGRQVEVDGSDIGRGFDLDGQVRWHPWKIDNPFYLAYAAEYSGFDANHRNWRNEAHDYFQCEDCYLPRCADAILPSVNRHALQAHAGFQLSKDVQAALTVEAAWRQETDDIELGSVAEMSWHMGTNADFIGRVEYYTGGAGPNAGSSVVLATAGIKIYW